MILKINENNSNVTSNKLSPLAEECLLEMEVSGLYLAEAAKFRFMPRIKERPELKKMWDVCSRAEALLNDNGKEPSQALLHKLGKLALRIFNIFRNISDAISLPCLILILPIPFYLLDRVMDYGEQLGEDKLAKSYARQCIKELQALKKETKDPKKVEKIEAQIEKLKKELADYDK